MYYLVVRRPLWFRALIALWGLWFTAALSEAPGLHTCEVHGAHGASSGSATHAGHHGHAAHAAPGSATSAPDGSSHHGPADCTCLGGSCCAVAAAVPKPAIDFLDSVVVAGHPATFADVVAPVVRRAHTLPFANGPPAA